MNHLRTGGANESGAFVPSVPAPDDGPMMIRLHWAVIGKVNHRSPAHDRQGLHTRTLHMPTWRYTATGSPSAMPPTGARRPKR